ncbi:MAG TPA: DinB family protein [Gemmatimonadales bacterium]|nr:DinB family protein [Gemmatimonadales bacterium]
MREQLAQTLEWSEAHADFDKAVAGLPVPLRGKTPAGLPYSPWQLVEHLRISQRDLLDFCRDPEYHERVWPDEYWPHSAAPPSDGAWDDSLLQFREDRAALQTLARDPSVDLAARIPHGAGQTYLRELLLAADHAAYHLGELIVVRRLLGAWPS